MELQPTSSTVDSDHRICLVCGAEAHGIHFQVNSCRACAAFFRRAAESGERYKCRRAKHNCDVSKDATHQCRRCRYERCKKVGMTLNNVLLKQHERQTKHCHNSNASVSQPTPVIVSCSSPISSYDPNKLPEVVFEDHKLQFKADDLIAQIKSILVNSYSLNPAPDITGVRLTPMQTFIHAYNKMLPGGKPERIEVLECIDFRVWMHFFKEMTKRTAIWMMACQEFAELPMEDKWKIYVNFWPHMYNVERAARSIEFLGDHTSQNSHILLQTDTAATDVLNSTFIIPNLSEEKQRGIRALFLPHDEAMISHFVSPMKALNMTTYEVVYLCTQLMWTVKKVKGLSEKTYETASRILDQTGNELHNYYVYEMRTENYASRLAKIVKLMSESENLYRHRKDALLTADVFGIFNSDLHESELINLFEK
ncbi:hypothetical protein QR680_006051 [Steinernema hermaphroditum]|uniref:Nuclear receptor domain-containing protein n=1 Tax=Steinernema hermaphroditum TaxID=289476 RepID=A0AA39HVH8_9BILA|nr:hypothetical protein QR680_006051 [Steinernema hermaphroditum]